MEESDKQLNEQLNEHAARDATVQNELNPDMKWLNEQLIKTANARLDFRRKIVVLKRILQRIL